SPRAACPAVCGRGHAQTARNLRTGEMSAQPSNVTEVRPTEAVSSVVVRRVLQPEEVAVPAVTATLLIDEVQLPGVEGIEPLIPGDVRQIGGTPGEVEAQDAHMAVVFAAFHRSGRRVARFGPLADHIVIAG